MHPQSLLASSAVGALIALAAVPAQAQSEPSTVDELVVTAAPYAVSLDTITTSVNLLSAEEISLAPPAGIGDLLSGLPGLRSTAYGPGASRPVIRGLAGPRVLLLQYLAWVAPLWCRPHALRSPRPCPGCLSASPQPTARRWPAARGVPKSWIGRLSS